MIQKRCSLNWRMHFRCLTMCKTEIKPDHVKYRDNCVKKGKLDYIVCMLHY